MDKQILVKLRGFKEPFGQGKDEHPKGGHARTLRDLTPSPSGPL